MGRVIISLTWTWRHESTQISLDITIVVPSVHSPKLCGCTDPSTTRPHAGSSKNGVLDTCVLMSTSTARALNDHIFVQFQIFGRSCSSTVLYCHGYYDLNLNRLPMQGTHSPHSWAVKCSRQIIEVFTGVQLRVKFWVPILSSPRITASAPDSAAERFHG